jgi:hypothetical protein
MRLCGIEGQASSGKKQCVPSERFCDGQPHCRNGYDESKRACGEYNYGINIRIILIKNNQI